MPKSVKTGKPKENKRLGKVRSGAAHPGGRRKDLELVPRNYEERLRFERLLADLSSRFIHLPTDQIDPEISAAQQRVCDTLGLDVSSLWQWRPDNPVMHTLTHYYRPLGGPPVPKTMKGQDYFPWCQRRVLAGEVVAVSSLADFPAEAARDRETFSFYGLRTTLTIPLVVGGGPVFGSVNFNDMRRDRRWSEALIQRLQLVAQIFANALARKVADQALRDSEARLSLAAEAAEIGLWSLNLATNLFWLTDKARALFKFTSGEDLTLERFLSLVHPDDRSPVHETLRTIVQARNEGQVQYRTVWPDGRVRWMLSRGRVRCGVSGEPECLMGVTADITERKLAEEELCTNQARLSSAIQLAGLGFYEMRSDGSVSFLDDRGCSLLGVPAGEESSAREYWLAHIHPEDADRVRQASRDLLVGKLDQIIVEYRYRHPSLGTIWLHHASQVLDREPAGRMIRLVGVLRDITKRKEADAVLRESEERLREAAEAAEFGVYRYDLVSGMAYHSPEFLALYGLPADAPLELASDLVPKAVHPDDKALFLAALKRSSDPTGSAILDVEFRIILGDGRLRWLRARGRTVFDGAAPDRRPVRANGVVLDITARKQAELDARRIQAEITHLSRVATIGELVASLAHELNQPLAAIQSNAQAGQRLLAAGQPDLRDIQDILADIVADDQRAAEVIRRVRALLKKEAIAREPLDLNAVIREVIGFLRADAIAKGVNIVFRLTPGPLPVLGDRIQLQQVLLNLITNAFDAMSSLPPEARELTIWSSRSEAEGAGVSVQDSGAGIPAENMASLFEPFYTTKPEGLGMGLVICRSIVQSHGGRIWAENAPRRGAVLRFTLPLDKDAPA